MTGTPAADAGVEVIELGSTPETAAVPLADRVLEQAPVTAAGSAPAGRSRPARRRCRGRSQPSRLPEIRRGPGAAGEPVQVPTTVRWYSERVGEEERESWPTGEENLLAW